MRETIIGLVNGCASLEVENNALKEENNNLQCELELRERVIQEINDDNANLMELLEDAMNGLNDFETLAYTLVRDYLVLPELKKEERQGILHYERPDVRKKVILTSTIEMIYHKLSRITDKDREEKMYADELYEQASEIMKKLKMEKSEEE